MDTHRPVLVEQVLGALVVRTDGTYVDATFGRGGHSAAILQRLTPAGRLIAFDRDPDAVAAGCRRFAGERRLTLRQACFGALAEACAAAGLRGAADGILLDVGVSSPQLDDPARGFSFMRDGPLDMRMDPAAGESAAQWIARVSESELADVLRRYGEEREHRRLARAIVAARDTRPIETTAELAAIVSDAARARREPGRHPATRAFQAIRIHINDELGELGRCLPQCLDLLAPGGRLCVISFHSLEDRIVKRYLRDRSRIDPRLAKLPVVPPDALPSLRLVGRAIRADAAEVAANPRSRSAVLRVAERLPGGARK